MRDCPGQRADGTSHGGAGGSAFFFDIGFGNSQSAGGGGGGSGGGVYRYSLPVEPGAVLSGQVGQGGTALSDATDTAVTLYAGPDAVCNFAPPGTASGSVGATFQCDGGTRGGTVVTFGDVATGGRGGDVAAADAAVVLGAPGGVGGAPGAGAPGARGLLVAGAFGGAGGGGGGQNEQQEIGQPGGAGGAVGLRSVGAGGSAQVVPAALGQNMWVSGGGGGAASVAGAGGAGDSSSTATATPAVPGTNGAGGGGAGPAAVAAYYAGGATDTTLLFGCARRQRTGEHTLFVVLVDGE